MSDVVASSRPLPGAVHPPAISLQEVWPWALFALALFTLMYTVAFQQGVLHEWMHDGRHLLGFPCH
jgi:cobalt transporter subunit CbtB